MPGPIREAVLARLSVWFSAALRPKQPDQQPLLPPFAVRLCQLPPRRQPPQTHGRPNARWVCASAPELLRISGQETVPGAAVHRLLQADALPASRREENNARPSTFESPPVPGNPCHNIIPSVLWNSRHRPHSYAVTASIRKGQKSARRSFPASDSTIRIMLRNSVGPSNHRHPPGRCRHLGYLRNFLAEGDCAAGEVSIVIPGYMERWGYELDKYQVYSRFVLLDTVTGYRSQYQDGAFIIKAR